MVANSRRGRTGRQGSWASNEQRGLLSRTALLDLFEADGPERAMIESARRPETVRVDHPVHGTAWIRDDNKAQSTRPSSYER